MLADVKNGVMSMEAGAVFDAGVSLVARIDVMVDILIDALVNCVMRDIGCSADVDANARVTMIAVLEFITLPVLLEGLLLF